MSGIGQTGKRSQNFGQNHQRRYQVGYVGGDSTPLTPRVQRRPAPSSAQPAATPSGASASTMPRLSNSPATSDTPESDIQREETTTAATTSTPAEATPENQSGAATIKPEDVANRVYAMWRNDLRRERERMGNPHLR